MRPLIIVVTAVMLILAIVLIIVFLIPHAKHVTRNVSNASFFIMEYKPFFPSYGRTSEATPITATFTNKTEIVIQDALWLSWAGINAILVDWSPTLCNWPSVRWSYINNTSFLLEVYHEMDEAHLPHPKVIIMIGLDNGRCRPPLSAVDWEVNWIYTHYVENPNYNASLFYYEGKPLLVALDGSLMYHTWSNPHFTIRFMAFHLENIMSAVGKPYYGNPWGYWSWMDGVITPVVVYRNGKPEAVTVTPAFFVDITVNGTKYVGWTAPGSVGRMNGATLIEEWEVPMVYRPKFIIIGQWDQFSGESSPPYLDQHTIECSQDIAPTVLGGWGAWGNGGWGYYYLVLLKALIMLYNGETPNATVMAIAYPLYNESITGSTLTIRWAYVGKQPRSFTVLIDGRIVASNITATWLTIPIYQLPVGWHEIAVIGNGAVMYFNLTQAYYELVNASSKPMPAEATVWFYYAGVNQGPINYETEPNYCIYPCAGDNCPG